MSDKLSQTQRILRSPKVKIDERGRSVWIDTVETARLELVSTQMLKQIIETEGSETSTHLRKISEGEDGLLVRDPKKGAFEIISDAELRDILDGADMAPATSAAGLVEEDSVEAVSEEENMELVSTRMLRIMLGTEDEEKVNPDGSPAPGFDPYDHS